MSLWAPNEAIPIIKKDDVSIIFCHINVAQNSEANLIFEINDYLCQGNF
jgi:hypothetical protein